MSHLHTPEERFMRLAIEEANDAKRNGDYAIGAVVILDDRVIGKSGNRVKIDADPTQHAEISAIRSACEHMGSRHILGAILYTTAEPCPMCASAAIFARIDGIVSGSTVSDMARFRETYGTKDWSWRTIDIATRTLLENGEPELFLIDGFLREECIKLFHDS